MDVTAHKQQLRRRIKQARRELDQQQRQAEQEAINQQLRALVDTHDLPIAAYMAMPDEVSCHDLITYAWQQQRSVFVPRVHGSRQLTWHQITAFADCAVGAYNILEPQTPATALPTAVCMLVPGVAFSQHGRRLGMGGGFYDQVLAQLATQSVSVGLAFSCQIVSAIPCEAHDATVQQVVYPQ